MSTSATRTTEFSFEDSLSCGVPGTGFLSIDRPSGKAVGKLPVSRRASGRDLPEGLKPLVASSPDLVASALSTSMELGELLTSSVIRSPSTGFVSQWRPTREPTPTAEMILPGFISTPQALNRIGRVEADGCGGMPGITGCWSK